MLHAEEERFLSDDKSSEIRASTDTLPEQASDAKNVIEGQTTRNEGRLNNTIELVDSDSDGEDVAATTATVAKEKSPVAHANSVMTTTIANSGDGGLAAVDVDDVPNLADRSLSTCKPAEITLIDSDDDENGDEISKATLTAFEKTVLAPTRKALTKFANHCRTAATAKKTKPAQSKAAAAASRYHPADKWAKGTGFGGSATSTQGGCKTAAERAAESAQTKDDRALEECANAVATCVGSATLLALQEATSSHPSKSSGAEETALPAMTEAAGQSMRAKARLFEKLLALLIESSDGGLFLEKLGVLLRSDSLLNEANDATGAARQQCFAATFALLGIVAGEQHLVLFLLTPIDREERLESQGITVANSDSSLSSSSASSSSSSSSSATAPPATLSSLLYLLEPQADTYLSLHHPDGILPPAKKQKHNDSTKSSSSSSGGGNSAYSSALETSIQALKSVKDQTAALLAGLQDTTVASGSSSSSSVGTSSFLTPVSDTATLCMRLQQVSKEVRQGCSSARASGVLTPALLAARRRARAKKKRMSSSSGGGLGHDEDEDCVMLDDGATEAALAYVKALKPLRFEAIDLLDLVTSGAASHAFASNATSATGRVVQGSAKQRLARLASEVSQLSASLPIEHGSSIFVRCDEERLDVLKALVIGPAGSPYENGCFVFDIWLPPSYPSAPPKVLLVTTGGGAVRFNPNLYNCGKVCLSLLGTWSGPGWDPVRSTLLQVLVSVQALIMVDEPFFNEPGYQGMLGTSQGRNHSDGYNATVREATVRHAMGDVLEPSAAVAPFKAVIEKHFRFKRAEILAQLARWEAMAPVRSSGVPGSGSGCPGTRSSFNASANRVRTLLASTSSTSSGGGGPTGGGTEKQPIVL